MAKTFKTSERNGNSSVDKIFLNIVHSDRVAVPSKVKQVGGDSWSVPYTVGPPHMQKDRKGENSSCYDCCFHPIAVELCETSKDFKDLVVTTAMDGVEQLYKRQGMTVRLDRKYHVVKGTTYKEGQVLTMMIVTQNKETWNNTNTDSPAHNNNEVPSGKKAAMDPPASAAEEVPALVSVNEPPIPEPAPAPVPTPAPVPAAKKPPAIKKGFLTSSKSTLYPEKLPTVRPSAPAAPVPLVQEVVKPVQTPATAAVAGMLDQQQAAPPALVDEMKEVSSKKVSRPSPPLADASAAVPPAAPAAGPVKPVVVCKHRDEVNLGDFEGLRSQQVGSSRPTELVYEIQLPLVSAASKVVLDLSERKLVLSYLDVYRLDMALPYAVQDTKAKAAFDKTKRSLTITLPLVKIAPQMATPAVTAVAPVALVEEKEDSEEAKSPVPKKSTTSAKDKDHSRWVAKAVPSSADAKAVPESADADRESRLLYEDVQRQAALAKQKAKDMVAAATAASKGLAQKAAVAAPSPATVQAVAAPTEPYLSASAFAGRRQGYVFKMDDKGLGYYLDAPKALTSPPALDPAPVPTPTPVVHVAAEDLQAIPYEVQVTPKMVSLLLQIPCVLPGSVLVEVTAYSIDIRCTAISNSVAGSVEVNAQGLAKVHYAQGFDLDQTACPGGLDHTTVKFDIAGQNTVVVIAKSIPNAPWQADCKWMTKRAYSGGEGKKENTINQLPAATTADTSIPEAAESAPAAKKAAVKNPSQTVAAAVSVMRFSTDLMSELD